MKSPIGYLLAGFVSAFVTFSAWADGSDGSGNILIAPQLAVATNGPVTATFLGASQAFPVYTVFAITETPLAGYALFSSNPFQPTTPQIPALSAGTNISFATNFLIPPDGGEPTDSSTGSASAVQAFFFEPPQSAVSRTILFNAGVIPTGPDRVLIGFTPSFSAPRGFGGFDVRIAVSNVCVR